MNSPQPPTGAQKARAQKRQPARYNPAANARVNAQRFVSARSLLTLQADGFVAYRVGRGEFRRYSVRGAQAYVAPLPHSVVSLVLGRGANWVLKIEGPEVALAVQFHGRRKRLAAQTFAAQLNLAASKLTTTTVPHPGADRHRPPRMRGQRHRRPVCDQHPF